MEECDILSETYNFIGSCFKNQLSGITKLCVTCEHILRKIISFLQNRATNSLHNDTRVIIELIDKNDEIPQFVALDQNGRYDGQVAENLAPGAEVIQVTATDRDEFPEYNKVSKMIIYDF